MEQGIQRRTPGYKASDLSTTPGRLLIPGSITQFLTVIYIDKEIVSVIQNEKNLISIYSKTCVEPPSSKRQKIGCQDQLSLNADQKYCTMHSAILSTFIKLPFVMKIFVFGYFCTGFIVHFSIKYKRKKEG